MYDIVFISYQEANAEVNYKKLISRFPWARRVHGIKGIHQAHILAARKSLTEMFYVVDGDAEVLDTFNFEFIADDTDYVYVWRSQNPINDLEYGYGGIKLLPRKLTINMDISRTDMTTSISKKFKPMLEVSNITAFNTDPFSTWRSAFRECVKLSSKVIDRQKIKETEDRLHVWKTVGKDRPFGEYAILGALQGEIYGKENKNNTNALKKINDFDWLLEKFNGN